MPGSRGSREPGEKTQSRLADKSSENERESSTTEFEADSSKTARELIDIEDRQTERGLDGRDRSWRRRA